MQLFRRFRKPNPTKVSESETNIGFALHANGRVVAIKQGSGMYGAGLGEGAFSETAFGTAVALSQSTFGWSAAYSVSTWVYRCIEVRKSAVHRIPWHVYNKKTKEIIADHPLDVALRRNRQRVFKKFEQSQLLYGETFFELAQNAYEFVSDLYWLNNNGMAVIIGAGKIEGYSYTAMQGGMPQNFKPDEIAFMKTDNPFNDLRGMSPTEVIMDEVAIDKDVARVVRAYYANDTRVGVIFIPKVNLLQADAERFMEIVKMQNQGVNKAGKPILMPQDMSVERIQEPATLDDVQLRESTRREIAAAYGVPLSMAGGWDDAKYQSLPEQRKSFYEETVIPECDNIDEFINIDMMPYFDDSGNAELRHDYMSILALTEDSLQKNEIYGNRLAAGGITRAEYRAALGHPVRKVDDVYYIPAGSTVVPADEEALVTPTANEVDDTSQEQQQVTDSPQQKPAIEAPDKPKELPAPEQPKAIAPPQKTALEELAAWEKKAVNSNAVKAATFVCYVVPKDVQDSVREGLQVIGRNASKAAIRGVFAAARKAIAEPVDEATKHPGHEEEKTTKTIQPPAATLDYWKQYDVLMGDIGSVWLNSYMERALQTLAPIVGNHTDADIQAALSAGHPEFQQALLGTNETPGPLVKLIMAGMGAGQEAINNGSAANPSRPVSAKALAVDWDLLAHEARDFARQYVFDLIRNVDGTTRQMVQEAVTKWLESGEGLDSLRTSLRAIFTDAARADLIAQTESTRAYAEGSLERYRRADVQKVKWNTVRSGVCKVCDELGAQEPQPISQGFKASSGNAYPPNHPGCRCWLRPVVED